MIEPEAKFCPFCGKPKAEPTGVCGHCQGGAVARPQTSVPAGPPYTNYNDVPVYRRQWFFWLSYLFCSPIGLAILISGDVYYPKNGEIKSFGMANRIVAGVLVAFWLLRAVVAVAR